MAAPNPAQPVPLAPYTSAPLWSVAGVPCLKEGAFPADAWITGLSVWGAEANWGKKWFDHQFAKTMPNKVCHLSAGQKFYFCLTSLKGMANGAELAADFAAGWQKEIDSNAPYLSPAGCGGQRGRPLDYAAVDDFYICPPEVMWSGTTVIPDVAAPQSDGPVGKSPGLIAEEEAAAAEAAKIAAAAAATKKAAAAAAAAAKAQIECRPLALWKFWFNSNKARQVETGKRLASLGVSPGLSSKFSYSEMVIALLSGKKVAGYNLQQIFPPDGWVTKKTKDLTLLASHPIPYGQSTWSKAIALAYKDPKLTSTIFSKCPTSQDNEENGITDDGTDNGTSGDNEPMGGGAMLALAALALWAVRK
jgi:hypothetical protein